MQEKQNKCLEESASALNAETPSAPVPADALAGTGPSELAVDLKALDWLREVQGLNYISRHLINWRVLNTISLREPVPACRRDPQAGILSAPSANPYFTL
jgi:hypothetical protein